MTTEVLHVAVDTIPVETVFEEDTTLGSGQVMLVSEGAPGQVEVRTVQNYVGGVAQGEPQVIRTVIRPMVPTVIRRGVEIAGANGGKAAEEPGSALPGTELEQAKELLAAELNQTANALESSAELGVYVITRPSIPKAAEAGSTASIDVKKRKQVAGPGKQQPNILKKPKKDAPELVVAKPKPRLVNTGADAGTLLAAAASLATVGLFTVVAMRTRKRLGDA
ncbi:MAG: G5 domain-containing protein [Actinomycetaceae bacterium]|nr:G5 domain-containing protein [Actinomycetaceae bacterium]